MLADLDLLLTAVFCTADDLLPEGQERQSEIDRRGGRDALRRPVDHGHPALIGASCGRRASGCRHLFPALAQAAGLPQAPRPARRHDRGVIALRHARAPAATTTCCWSTPPRSSAPARARRSTRRRQQPGATPPTTATAPATAAASGACACTALFAPDGTPRAVTLTSAPRRDEREVCLRCWSAHCTAADRPRRQGLRRRHFAAAAAALGATIVRPARKDEPDDAPHLRRSASASSRSSGPAKTSSPSNATAPAPCTTSAPASPTLARTHRRIYLNH